MNYSSASPPFLRAFKPPRADACPVPYREFSSKDLRSVGNYTIGRLIGKGSFGKVYLASHKLTNGSKVCLDALLPIPREDH